MPWFKNTGVVRRFLLSACFSAVTFLVAAPFAFSVEPDPALLDNAKTTGGSSGDLVQGRFGDAKALNQNLNVPMTNRDSKMFTLDGSQQFDAALGVPSSNKFLEIIIQPGPTGDLSNVIVAQDLNADNVFDHSFTIGTPVSGVCSNGFISCTPGTWESCSTYMWVSDTTGRLQVQAMPLTALSGCFCINSSCGSNLAWTNSGVVLQALGGGAVGSIRVQDATTTITNVAMDPVSITYYGQLTRQATSESANVPATAALAGPQEQQKYYTNWSDLGAERDNISLTQSTDPNSLYYQLTNSSAQSGAQERSCSVTRVGTLETSGKLCPDTYPAVMTGGVTFDKPLVVAFETVLDPACGTSGCYKTTVQEMYVSSVAAAGLELKNTNAGACPVPTSGSGYVATAAGPGLVYNSVVGGYVATTAGVTVGAIPFTESVVVGSETVFDPDCGDYGCYSTQLTKVYVASQAGAGLTLKSWSVGECPIPVTGSGYVATTQLEGTEFNAVIGGYAGYAESVYGASYTCPNGGTLSDSKCVLETVSLCPDSAYAADWNTGYTYLYTEHYIDMQIWRSPDQRTYKLQLLDWWKGRPHYGTLGKSYHEPMDSNSWHTIHTFELPMNTALSAGKLTRAIFSIRIVSGRGCTPGSTYTIDGAVQGFNVRVNVGGQCGGSGVQRPYLKWSYYFEYKEDRYVENISDGCTALENDPSCRIKGEIVDGVPVTRGFGSTGLVPLPTCKVFDGEVETFEICRPWWNKRRNYVCDVVTPSYDLTRFKTIKDTTTMDGTSFSFTDYRQNIDGSWSNAAMNGILPAGDTYETCMPSCKVNRPALRDETTTAGLLSDNLVDSSTFEIRYLSCGTDNVCPVEPGDQIVSACGCLDEFPQAATIMQTMRLSGADNICSSGTAKPP